MKLRLADVSVWRSIIRSIAEGNFNAIREKVRVTLVLGRRVNVPRTRANDECRRAWKMVQPSYYRISQMIRDAKNSGSSFPRSQFSAILRSNFRDRPLEFDFRAAYGKREKSLRRFATSLYVYFWNHNVLRDPVL